MLRDSFGAYSTRSRKDIEDFWRARLQRAREQHQNAMDESRRAILDHALGASEPPDGSFALQQLHTRESAALREYMRVLKVFTDLIVNDKIPEAS